MRCASRGSKNFPVIPDRMAGFAVFIFFALSFKSDSEANKVFFGGGLGEPFLFTKKVPPSLERKRPNASEGAGRSPALVWRGAASRAWDSVPSARPQTRTEISQMRLCCERSGSSHSFYIFSHHRDIRFTVCDILIGQRMAGMHQPYIRADSFRDSCGDLFG